VERSPKTAQRRGKSLEKSLLKYWDSPDTRKMALMVVSGFHVEGIVKQLNESGESVVVLKPEVALKSVEQPIKS
jgi:hypothetical protein